MFGWNRRKSNTTAATPEKKSPQVAEKPSEPLTEREQLLRQQYERLANHHAIEEAEPQARHQQD